MKSSARLLLAALYTFNQLSWADPASAKEYMEWVFVSEKGGEQYFMKVRQSEVGEGAYVRDVTYGHNGAIVHQEASITGVIAHQEFSISYEQKVSASQQAAAQDVLDHANQEVAVAFPAMTTLSYQFGPAPAGGSLAAESIQQIQSAQQSLAGDAAHWAAVNAAEHHAQQETVRDTDNRVRTYKKEVDQNLLEDTIRAYGFFQNNDLAGQLKAINADFDVLENGSRLHAVAFSEKSQQTMIDDFDEFRREGDISRMAVIASDLSTPLNATSTDRTRSALADMGVRNGVVPGSVLRQGDRTSLRDRQLEDSRIRAQNQLQIAGNKYAPVMRGKGRDYARAVQFLLKAAAKAEAAGDVARAESLTKKAREYADALAGRGDPRSLDLEGPGARQAFIAAMNEFNSGSSMGLRLDSSDPAFRELAEPVAQILGEFGASATGDQVPVANAGRYFLTEADAASVAGNGQIASAYLDMAIMAVDVGVAFIGPVGAVKDGYEAVTGKHWITGRDLSNFERGVAVAGLVTLGIGSAVIKGGKLVRAFLQEVRVGEEALRVGGELAGEMQKAGIKTAETWARIEPSIAASGSPAKAATILTDITKPARERMAALGFKTEIKVTHFADDLNAQAIAQNPKFYGPYRPGTMAYDVVATEAPKDLMHVYREGKSPVGNWFARKEVFESLRAESKSAREFAEKVGDELNLTYVPHNIATLDTTRTGFDMRVSEIGMNVGKREGQLQFELAPLADELKEIQTLEQYFNAGRK